MKYTTEQRSILTCNTGSIRILAAAGSGKTTTMAQKVKEEVDSDRCRPEEICFITFTRFAADQIRSRVKRVIGQMIPILCGTFHSMMYRMLLSARPRTPSINNLYDARMDKWVSDFMDLVRRRDPAVIMVLIRYKLLIVDEFQDLDETQFEFVSLFKSIKPSLRVIAIGDLAQNIYRFRGTSNEFLRTKIDDICSDLQTFTLTTNFRSTRAILTLVNTIFQEEIKDGHILPMIPAETSAEGMKPKYYEFAINPGKGLGEYEELVAETLLSILLRAKSTSKSVALIFPITKCTTFEFIMTLLRQYSKERSYSLDLHKIAKEDETCSTVSFVYDPKDNASPVQFSTIHSAKGLEWDIVALIDMSDYIYSLRGADDCEAFYAEKTNLTYVAITRAAEELYIFANANCGGRHRKLAELGAAIKEVLDVTIWGDKAEEWGAASRRPIGVTELIRRLPQHPDLFNRIRACSGHIIPIGVDGVPMNCQDVYNEMKSRNRELAFGTFIDWKLKRMLCGKQTFQDVVIELITCYNSQKLLYRRDAYDDTSTRITKLDAYFTNANKVPIASLEQYLLASRYIALQTGRFYSLTDTFRHIYQRLEGIILRSGTRENPSLKDEYIMSQLKSFYMNGSIGEIQALDAPPGTYMGMPKGFQEFVMQNIAFGADVLRGCLRDTGASGAFKGDVCLESASLIMGEADIISENGVLLEIKCSTSTKAIEMRDVGNCKHLLQVLAYVALARHGTIPIELKKACIVNPLTGAWERYDLEGWREAESAEFMACLEELRERC